MDFAGVSLLGDAAQYRRANGAGRGAAGGHQADFLAPAHREQPQGAHGVVHFINHL
jgi:hypothetical protein